MEAPRADPLSQPPFTSLNPPLGSTALLIPSDMLRQIRIEGDLTLDIDGDAVRVNAADHRIVVDADGVASLRRLILAFQDLKPTPDRAGGDQVLNTEPTAGSSMPVPGDAAEPPSSGRRDAAAAKAVKAAKGLSALKKHRSRVNDLAARLDAAGYVVECRIDQKPVITAGHGVEPGWAEKLAGLKHVKAESVTILQSLFT